MCVAGLNVSTQPCSHRWYELVRACKSTHDLSNCPEKLRLEGWETRNETCPWCSDSESAVHETTHRLFSRTNTGLSTASTSTSTFNTTAPPPTNPSLDLVAIRTHRSGSAGTMSSTGALSRHGSFASSVDVDPGARSREMNDRLMRYLTLHHHEVLPSARRYQPTSSSASSGVDVGSAGSDTGVSIASAGARLGRGWRKSVRLSRVFFGS